MSASAVELPVYRRAEVSARNGAGAPVWIIYKDYVYDVTNYVKEHPGGDVLLEEAGRDTSDSFDDVGHSSDARQVLAKLKIGRLPEEERQFDDRGKRLKSADAESRSCLSICCCGLLS